jgi:hypothetical protein
MCKMFSAAVACVALAGGAAAQSLTPLAHPAPNGAVISFLLTDGTVLVQGGNYSDWWKLTPDSAGSYVHGTWARQASLPAGYVPDAFASAVLADGRLVIMGGEYTGNKFMLTDMCAVYDPLVNTWTKFAAPAGWGYIGDSPSVVLPNGKLLLGRKLDKRIALLDPATLTWTEQRGTGKRDFNAEEGWTLLPGGRVLTYDVKSAPHSEIYVPGAQSWINAGLTGPDLASPPESGPIPYGHGLVYTPPGEVGPAILRPDGTVFATGGTPKGQASGHTAIYAPPLPGHAVGTWTAGPNFPSGEDAADSFAALLPNGDVIVEAESGKLYDFNGTTLLPTGLNGQAGVLMMLPTGELLVNGTSVLRAAGAPNPAWAPVIQTVPSVLARGHSYAASGTQFNGLSQAAAFGDEEQTATNYPLVRITNTATGHVVYARTHGHSTMGVATGALRVSTQFDVPAGAEIGAGTLVVVANGIASAGVGVVVQ